MEFAEIKKAIIDYATGIETAKQQVSKNFTSIANSQNDLSVIEDKWTDADLQTIEDSINALTDDAVKASYLGQLGLLRAQRDGFVAKLETLYVKVNEAGLMDLMG